MEDVRPSSPQRLVFSMATFDIVEDDDDNLEFVPLVDHGIGREDIVVAEQKISERSTHGGYETDPVLIEENITHHEMLQELIGKPFEPNLSSNLERRLHLHHIEIWLEFVCLHFMCIVNCLDDHCLGCSTLVLDKTACESSDSWHPFISLKKVES